MESVRRKDVPVVTVLDPKFKYEVAREPGGENIKYCFQCGTCTSGCKVAELDSKYNPPQNNQNGHLRDEGEGSFR